MKLLQPGLIVSVPGMKGMYVVLAVDPNKGLAILLSRDGRKRIVRGVPIHTVEIMTWQMLAYIDQTHKPPAGVRN